MVSCKVIFVVIVAALAAASPFIYKFKAGCEFKSSKPINLSDKIALITGANTGIGLETARELLKRGCQVILACRSEKRCNSAKKSLDSQLKANASGKSYTLLMDLSSLKSIESAAALFMKEHKALHYLILNAGVLAHSKVEKSVDGHELHFAVNHLGHFFLTELLLPFMKRTTGSDFIRIVSVSSMAHYMFANSFNFDDIGLTKDYSSFYSYGQSKLANVLHMRELADREITSSMKKNQTTRVIAVSLHPGAVFTELGRSSPLMEFVKPLLQLMTYIAMKTPLEGAQTTLHCVLFDSREILKYNGAYFHDCEPRATSVHAQSLVDAKRLWKLSEEIISNFKQSDNIIA